MAKDMTEAEILRLAPQVLSPSGQDITKSLFHNIRKDISKTVGVDIPAGQNLTKPDKEKVEKAFNTANSPTNSGLYSAAQIAYFDQTPLTNMMGRKKVSTPGKSVSVDTLLGIPTNPLNPFGRTTGGKRGSEITPTWLNKTFPLTTIGQESNAYDELVAQGMGYLDALSVSGMAAFYGARRAEEINVLLSNLSVSLAAPSAPTVTTVTTGGTVPAGTYNVFCVACTHEGYLMGLGNSPLALVPTTQTITNVNGFVYSINGGHSTKSASGSVTTTGTTSIIRASVPAVVGAHWYAWYAGTAGNETLQGFTGGSSITFSAPLSTTNQNASAITTNVSQQIAGYAFDGLLAQAYANPAYAYIAAQGVNAATNKTNPLTNTGAGRVAEFDTMFSAFWQNYRISPDLIILSARDMVQVNNIVTGTSSSNVPILQYIVDTQSNQIKAGLNVGAVMNVSTNTLVPLQVHPDLPQGTIFAWCQNLGQFYQGTTVTQANELLWDRDWTQENFPRTERSQSTGCYTNETLVCKFLPGLGVITNIGDTNQL